MPFYDLRCSKCGKEFNVRASMTERAEKSISCSDCGSHDLDAVFKAANFIVKNDGGKCPKSHICGSNCSHAHG